ncbi:MAG: cyclase family protein [Gammaproteobacteria bacterium]|nr:cyclase family protein [Gammaproteobacteria bacterium]
MNKPIEQSVTTRSGAIRFVDAAATKRGMQSVVDYESVSIGLPIIHGKGPVAPMRQLPQHYLRRDGADYAAGSSREVEGFGFSDDVLIIGTHGTSHVDALCHVFCGGKMFGGLPANQVGSNGAKQLGVETIPPLVTRALVVDAVPEGRLWLDPGEAVTVDTLRKKLRAAQLEPQPGDALIVRTGWVEAYRGGQDSGYSSPGLSSDCIDWLREQRFSLIGADNIAVEVNPSGVAGKALPLHVELMFGDGVLFVELLDLEVIKGRVAAAMFTLNPLRIVGGTASPVAPMLMF